MIVLDDYTHTHTHTHKHTHMYVCMYMRLLTYINLNIDYTSLYFRISCLELITVLKKN